MSKAFQLVEFGTRIMIFLNDHFHASQTHHIGNHIVFIVPDKTCGTPAVSIVIATSCRTPDSFCSSNQDLWESYTVLYVLPNGVVKQLNRFYKSKLELVKAL